MTKKIENTTQIRVRYVDTDKMGIVYNGNYLSFFETGRTELMRSYGLPYTKVEKEGFLLPLIDAYVKYKNPAKYDDILNVKAEMDFEESPKLKFNYEITVDNKLITTGYTRHIFVRADDMKPVRPPSLFTQIIEEYNI